MILPPDFLTDFKTWAADTLTVPGGVVWKIPTQPVYPIVRIYSVGLAREGGEAPLWGQRLAWAIWGNSDDQFGQIKDIAAQLCGELDAIPTMTVIGTCLVRDAHVYGCEETPDPDTGWPGFTVDARIIASRI